MLEKFISFARDLPAESRESLEITLAQIMDSYSDKYDFTPDQLADMEKRMAEANPEYASQESIAAIFGKPFSA